MATANGVHFFKSIISPLPIPPHSTGSGNPFGGLTIDMDRLKSGEPWTHPAKKPFEGVPSSVGDLRVTYAVQIVRDPSSPTMQNYLTSEALFNVNLNPHKLGVLKTYTLSQLNELLLNQHDVLVKYLKSTGRMDDMPQMTSSFLTEDNFSKNVSFLGFAAETTHNQYGQTTEDNPSAPTKVIAIHAKGKLDSAYLWGGGSREVTAPLASHFAFVVKRMNRRDEINRIEVVSLSALLEDIGPLQVLPIASTKKDCYLEKTFKDSNTFEVMNMVRASSHRTPVKKQLQPLNIYARPSASQIIFSWLEENYHIDAFHRGKNFVTISNLIGKIFAPDEFGRTVNVELREGLVIRIGYAKDIYTDPPPKETVAQALCQRNHRAQSGVYHLNNQTNVPHGVLQNTYGIHVYVSCYPSTFFLDTGKVDTK